MSSDPIETLPRTLTTDEAVLLLARDPRDAGALITIYENHYRRLRQAATRWFGRDPEMAEKAINSILVAIGRQAGTYDPQSMDPGKWIHQCADAEARRLREALDTARNKVLGRRPM